MTSSRHMAMAWALFALLQVSTWVVKSEAWMLASYHVLLSLLAAGSALLVVWIIKSARSWRVASLALIGFVVGQVWLFQWLFMQVTFTR